MSNFFEPIEQAVKDLVSVNKTRARLKVLSDITLILTETEDAHLKNKLLDYIEAAAKETE